MRATDRFLLIAIVLVALVFSSSAAVSIATLLTTSRSQQREPTRPAERDPTPGYHFMAVLPPETGTFFSRLEEGLQRAAFERSVGVETQVPFTADGSLSDLLEIARLAGVDGVILYVTNERELTPYIDRLELQGVPVVTVESDAPASRRSTFVGTNSAELGRRIGELLVELRPDGVRLSMVKSLYFSDAASQWNIISYGVTAMLSGAESNRILATVASPRGVVTAEDAARRALFLHPETNVIFATSVVDTLAAVQAVEEFTAPESVLIVGYGGSERLQEALTARRVAALVERRPYDIAHTAVAALIDLLDGKYVPAAIYVGSEIVLP